MSTVSLQKKTFSLLIYPSRTQSVKFWNHTSNKFTKAARPQFSKLVYLGDLKFPIFKYFTSKSSPASWISVPVNVLSAQWPESQFQFDASWIKSDGRLAPSNPYNYAVIRERWDAKEDQEWSQCLLLAFQNFRCDVNDLKRTIAVLELFYTNT